MGDYTCLLLDCSHGMLRQGGGGLHMLAILTCMDLALEVDPLSIRVLVSSDVDGGHIAPLKRLPNGGDIMN